MAAKIAPISTLVDMIAAGARTATGLYLSSQRFLRENALARRIDFNLVLVLSVPFILLLANDEWLFPYGNPTDAWHNNSYFFETGNDYPPLYMIYKATRLSWILKGSLAHALFPPLTAYYVLHLTIFSAILAVFYLIVRNLMNAHVAVIATIAFGTYSQFHSVISFEWDYETHDGALNMLLTLLFLLLAAKGARWRTWLLLAGAAWASALQSTYVGTYILILPFWYLFLNHRFERHPILASICYVAVGGLATTLVYCVVSYLLGGPFLFFMTLIEPIWGFGFVGGFRFHIGYWQPLEHVLQYAKGLAVPLSVTGLSAAVLAVIRVRRQRGPVIDAVFVTTVSLLIAFTTHVLFHLVGHGHLANDHMLAYMAPFVFLAVAGVYAYLLRISGITVPTNAAKATAVKVVVLVIFCGALIFGMSTYTATSFFIRSAQEALGLPHEFRSWYSISTLLLLFVFLAATLVLSVSFAWLRHARYYVPVLCFSAFLALANVQNTSISIASYDWKFECGYLKDQYEAIIDTYFKIRRFDPEYDLRLWYGNNETVGHPDDDCTPMDLARITGRPVIRLTDLYSAVWGFRFFSIVNDPTRDHTYEYDGLVEEYLSSESFAEFSNRRLAVLPKAFRAAILARDPRDHATALNTLRSHGLKPIVLDRSQVRHGVISFDITILDVRQDARLKARSRM